MAVTDPIADMLTRIRNAIQARQKTVSFPASYVKREICRILVERKFLRKFVVVSEGNRNVIKALLKFKNGESVIQGLQRISTPGRRVYRSADTLPKVLNGLGIAIISTSRGMMTDYDAKQNKVGGEVMCKVW
ncbi:MAG: 30S ribosomal protein S8 [Candidatus Raymondbacteria bacterium RifOxyA12_full_50_37]|uniref:Small ribosomal subunit protein uS8 n=1 Tax=Candidatus Raymondbacteria bacterium RIFOXYD12_FULL_49_13 TaxID=1817890 RepID=A0A1F7FD56_UNCRA|nr:ribosomal protein S8 [uncultured bacterium]OGJ88091.1 MAG: 30S ribosomal protein S8 [Candidatus Raymondbacteria bacterium RifOxyA12_full_50_37]OGJ94068.1 MAG: 30S ribosomal protein S8 [Candidatus Raymondbacteria bacterium RIFOXYA2_FULL_49_16]OGJ96823.1 MAG: 30S ribosomal protein S8 [Candidatus Raymondbacteria bacterium RifOxyC12_full_50_8]OGJ96893.1 MAG: 30S ribosomal protein S8 [Candidatus Raymondbacteria bacterium RIFOXYC2_FULL_50_21]OGK04619.1 MAG: 30S ribosomal protein S8 [Candidatus Ra